MIALCTGKPKASTEGEQIVVKFPSGKGSVEIAMSLDQALWLFQDVRKVSIEALDNGFAAPTAATLIAFPAREARHG